MLLILMYHQIYHPEKPNTQDILYRHLQMLKERFAIVLPGERLARGRLSVCLTFDDAYYDFYALVFPLLQSLQLRALLAVPVGFIVEGTTASAAQRLAAQRAATTRDEYPDYQQNAPFCTWPELQEMAASGWVSMASHSHHHVDLTLPSSDFQTQVVESKSILQQRLNCEVDTLIYPYGRMERELNQRVRRHYRYAMRIGSALNWGWDNPAGVLYRVDAERFWPDLRPWRAVDTGKSFIKMLTNTVRGK